MNIKKLSIFILLILSSTVNFAQSRTVTGKVIDAYSQASLADISISVQSPSADPIIKQTDANGNFTFEIAGATATLTFKYPGYKNEVVILGNSIKELLVRMLPEDLTSVLNSIEYDAKSATTAFSFEEVLAGKEAGLEVIKRSGIASEGSLMNIRGVRSLLSKNTPLVIVDGMPMEVAPFRSANDGYTENPLKDIDVKDIESVSILKNGSTIYGSRAAGGVILIETKKADGVKTYIDFTGFGGMEFAPREIPMMNSSQYNKYLVEQLKAQGVSLGEMETKYPWLANTTNPNYLNDTNWQREAYRNQSAVQNYYLNVRGGDETAKYSISLGFMDKRNPMGEVGSQRYNTHINGDLQIVKQLKMKVNLGYTVSKTDLLPFGVDVNLNPVTATLRKAPVFSPYEQVLGDNGEVHTMNVLSDTDLLGMSNPIALIEKSSIENNTNHLFGSIGLDYDIYKGIKASVMAGLDYNKVRQDLFIPSLGVVKIDGIEYDRKSERNIQSYSSFYANAKVDYDKVFSLKHLFNVEAGVNYNRTNFIINKGTDYSMPNDEFKGLSSGSSSASTSSIDMKRVFYNNYHWNTASVYLSAKYDYANIVGVSLQSSINGSSNYVKGTASINRAVSAYWNLAEHSFLSNSSWLDVLKLRVDVSTLGNDAISGIHSSLYYKGQGYDNTAGLVIGNMANPELENEITKQINAGLDFAIFGERLVITADYYKSLTKNVILWDTATGLSGLSGYWTNGASISNTGLELGLTANIFKGDFNWTVSGNIASNRSVVESMKNDEPLITSIYGGQTITQVGGAPVEFYGLNEKGEYASLGSAMPKFFGGFSTSFEFRGVELDVNFTYKSGNEAFNYTRMMVEGGQSLGNQTIAAVGMNVDLSDKSLSSMSYRWIEDASYLRLSKVRLAYNFPINNKIIKGIKIFADADNLFTWTNYLGYNPDFSYSDSPFTQGVDYGKMPYGQSVVFGIKLGL